MAAVDAWRWDETAFLRAVDAGVFDGQRVELVDGEVWPVTIGAWHGCVAMNVARLLPNDEWRITSASLPAGDSLPDPDVWVHRRSALPSGSVGASGRVARWTPSDVVLVVEVADASLAGDTGPKADLYGRAGFPCYWVVHRSGVEVFTEPGPDGYTVSAHHPADGTVDVPYAAASLRVADLLDAEG